MGLSSWFFGCLVYASAQPVTAEWTRSFYTSAVVDRGVNTSRAFSSHRLLQPINCRSVYFAYSSRYASNHKPSWNATFFRFWNQVRPFSLPNHESSRHP
ncbi:hypothetical protein BD410DRAFT_790629 [Rickenella mellea]|uniref:Secreted protein n=1 Tax=Rickenella mellea TaxID=50990 RepID=A0A4Y7Q1K4_9AGAM|nr:hypothetical protein BD410DRAFT_790629 [Rickenella mellea]